MRISAERLARILDAAPPDPDFTGYAHLNARFDRSVFAGGARFAQVVFGEDTSFEGATFEGDATFDWTVFKGGAASPATTFRGDARLFRRSGRDVAARATSDRSWRGSGSSSTGPCSPSRSGSRRRPDPLRSRAQFAEPTSSSSGRRSSLDDAEFGEPSMLAPRREPVPGEDTDAREERSLRLMSARRARSPTSRPPAPT